jgi:hypothetical protein
MEFEAMGWMSGAILVGSVSLSVQTAILKREHTCAKQSDAGATIHRPLERLQSVDLPLGLAVAPWLCHSVLHRAFVLPQYLCKTSHGENAARKSVS